MRENGLAVHSQPSFQTFADAKRSDADLVLSVHSGSLATEEPHSPRSLDSHDSTYRTRGEGRVWMKIDLAVLPVVTMLFFLSFLVSHSRYLYVS